MRSEDDLLRDLMLLARAAQIVLQEEVLESIEDADIGPTKANLMRLLRRQGSQTVNDLARFLGQTKAAASQNVDSLVRGGIVRRDPDKKDRRCVWVSLTARGSRILQKLETRQKKALRKAVNGMGESALEATAKSMRTLANALLESSEMKTEACLQCCAYSSMGCVYDRGAVRCNYLRRGEKDGKE